jgi:tRNA A37 threonylcarbamoyladenosine synthetase subunit TsaC/SUA5/YrdC
MHARLTRAPQRVTASMDALEPVARVLEGGGLAAIPWGDPRRAIYALLTRADDRDATLRLNELKGRPPEQVLAVVGATGVARQVADLGPSSTVDRIAADRRRSSAALLDGLYATGPVGLMLPAVDTVPPAIAEVDETGQARVLVVGQAPHDPGNFYDQLVDHLAMRRGVLLAGSSGNRSGERTHTTGDHEAAEADLAPDVDVFVRPPLPVPRRRRWDAPVSCTAFDLTTPEVTLIRHGSLHPDVFRPVLRHYAVSPSAQLLAGRQGTVAGMVERARRVA